MRPFGDIGSTPNSGSKFRAPCSVLRSRSREFEFVGSIQKFSGVAKGVQIMYCVLSPLESMHMAASGAANQTLPRPFLISSRPNSRYPNMNTSLENTVSKLESQLPQMEMQRASDAFVNDLYEAIHYWCKLGRSALRGNT